MSFSVASTIATSSSSSVLRFILEEGALFLSRTPTPLHLPPSPTDLRDSVHDCIVDVGLFDLSLRYGSALTVHVGFLVEIETGP